MKLFIPFNLLIFLFISCEKSTKDLQANELEHEMKDSLNDDQKYLIQEFKKNFLYECLKVGYNNEEIKTCLKNDHSPAGDYPLGTEGYKMIDSLALQYRNLIIKDSIYLAELDHGLDYVGKKRVIQVCLTGYDGEIDSIARKRYGH